MKHVLLLSLLLLLAAAAVAQSSPAVSPAVQLGIHYGPRRDAMISGVVAGDGTLVLTQGSALRDAKEVVIALSDGNVLDASVERVFPDLNVGLVRAAHRITTPPPLLAHLPPGVVAGRLTGCPESFRVQAIDVQLTPLEGRQGWRMAPAPPAAFAGAAVMSLSGSVVGIALREADGKYVVVPATELAHFLAPRGEGARAGACAEGEDCARPPEGQPAEVAAAPDAPAARESPRIAAEQGAPATERAVEAGSVKPPATAAGKDQSPEPAARADAERQGELRPAEASNGPAAPKEPATPAAEAQAQPGGEPASAASAPANAAVAPVEKEGATPAQVQPKTGEPAAEPAPANPAPAPPVEKKPESAPASNVEAASTENREAATEPASGSKSVAPTAAIAAPVAPETARAAPADTASAAPSIASVLDQWKERIALEPGKLDWRIGYAGALQAVRRPGDATEVLQRALADFPNATILYWHLGLAYLAQAMTGKNMTIRCSQFPAACGKSLLAFEDFMRLAPNDPHAADAGKRIAALHKLGFHRK